MPADFAGQALIRLADALDRAVTKDALKGDRQALDALRQELRIIRHGLNARPAVPVTFSGKKQIAFESLVRGATATQAAEDAGASKSQVSRWQNEPEVAAALDIARRERIEAATRGLNDVVPLAVARLAAVLEDPASGHREAIAAAKEVLDRAGIPKTERVEMATTIEAIGWRKEDAEELAKLEVSTDDPD